MNTFSAQTPVLADLPAGLEWDFGAFVYGLEPLTLPEPGTPYGTSGSGDDPEEVYGEACRLIWRAGDGDGPAGPPATPGDETDELYWFRWITGHQVSFIAWRLMAQLAADAESGLLPAQDALAQMRQFVRVYSAMLLYAGSCPRGVYHRVIRQSMRLRHRSFSGSWAPDFGPVRELLRARRLAFPPSAELTSFVEAVKVHQTVHDGIAAKLVPSGVSLLRQSGARGMDLRVLQAIYDSYFLTFRAPVCRDQVVSQLLRRLMAIVQDVAVNGLRLDAGHAELPAELLTSEAICCVNEFTEILVDAASCAAPVAGGARPSRTAGAR
jgi:L-tyrosine peroxygenase